MLRSIPCMNSRFQTQGGRCAGRRSPMKIMDGCMARATSNSIRTSFSPSPYHLLVSELALMLKKVAFASLASACPTPHVGATYRQAPIVTCLISIINRALVKPLRRPTPNQRVYFAACGLLSKQSRRVSMGALQYSELTQTAR